MSNGKVVGYISEDGWRVTDWHGKELLGRIVHRSSVRLARWSPCHGSTVTHYRVRLADGRLAYGRSNPGMIVCLTPYRTKETS